MHANTHYTVPVSCEGSLHHISVGPRRHLILHDHPDLASERAFHALAGHQNLPHCLRVAATWSLRPSRHKPSLGQDYHAPLDLFKGAHLALEACQYAGQITALAVQPTSPYGITRVMLLRRSTGPGIRLQCWLHADWQQVHAHGLGVVNGVFMLDLVSLVTGFIVPQTFYVLAARQELPSLRLIPDFAAVTLAPPRTQKPWQRWTLCWLNPALAHPPEDRP